MLHCSSPCSASMARPRKGRLEAVQAGHAGSRSKQRKRARLSEIPAKPACGDQHDEGQNVEMAATMYVYEPCNDKLHALAVFGFLLHG